MMNHIKYKDASALKCSEDDLKNNRVELRGSVGSVKTYNIGDIAITRFSLVTNRAYKDENGENIMETTWHDCIGTGEKYTGIKKNDTVHLVGRIRVAKVISANGESIQTHDIIVKDLIED